MVGAHCVGPKKGQAHRPAPTKGSLKILFYEEEAG